jgi:asparagine synthase (glutamine-hydrolysing)
MCGFAGLVAAAPRPLDELAAIASRMNSRLRHRGPDMQGSWTDPAGHAAMAFSRLSIRDLSAAANQPMQSESGRYVLAFNGEIYNTEELRECLGRSEASFRTTSDTEVLLASIDRLGVHRALSAANGMYAIAAYDRHERKTYLARDRFGKKPLHYARTGGALYFASEIKALLQAVPTTRGLSHDAIEAYFGLTYIPAPLCIFEGFSKVLPGHILEVSADLAMSTTAYWRPEEALARARAEPRLGIEEAIERTDSLLCDAVKRRLVGDVPVGLLLSGGVDSGLVGYYVSQAGANIRSFTIGLEDASLDERQASKRIAAAIGIPNVSLTLSASDALACATEAARLLDEPFGDYSAIPTHAVCKMARSHATVLLGGDGGDEVFGGYLRYRWSTGWRAGAVHAYASSRTHRPVISSWRAAIELYRRTMTLGSDGGSLSSRTLERLLGDAPPPPSTSLLDCLRLIDLRLYLPDDILVKTDRMSMASSVELRSPMLDYRLLELSWQFNDEALVSSGKRKRVTQALFERHVGASLLQQQKFGFSLPMALWLGGPMREATEEAVRYCVARPDVSPHIPDIADRWRRTLDGDAVSAHRVWLVFAFWRWAVEWEEGIFIPWENFA